MVISLVQFLVGEALPLAVVENLAQTVLALALILPFGDGVEELAAFLDHPLLEGALLFLCLSGLYPRVLELGCCQPFGLLAVIGFLPDILGGIGMQ